MKTQQEVYYQALLTRDYRFDGKFFVGVKTTGIYCRPICPAKPKRENIEFFPDALGAEKAGYRPCLRCRPESAPQSPAWGGRSALVQRALKLISNNALSDLDEDAFADLLGVTARHLRRLFEQEIGKTPKQIWDHNRLDFARKLIVETSLPFTEIAFTAGFSSVRRFNDSVKNRFHRAPSDLRREKATYDRQSGIELSLAYRPPFDWESLIQFCRSHETAGVENVGTNSYERIFKFDDALGALRVEPGPNGNSLKLKIVAENHKHLFLIVQRVRQMFDLDSDPAYIANSFSGSKVLSRLCMRYPGLRIPRAWDPYETAICTILGQLVSVEQGGRFAKQLVHGYGAEVKNPLNGKTSHLFPTPQVLARAKLSQVGTTQARKDSIREFSRLVAEKRISLAPTQDPLAFRKALVGIKGVGPWTAEFISLRALGDTDAFPRTDLILKRALEAHPELNLETMRPWRGYAAIYLWKEYSQSLSRKSEKRK